MHRGLWQPTQTRWMWPSNSHVAFAIWALSASQEGSTLWWTAHGICRPDWPLSSLLWHLGTSRWSAVRMPPWMSRPRWTGSWIRLQTMQQIPKIWWAGGIPCEFPCTEVRKFEPSGSGYQVSFSDFGSHDQLNIRWARWPPTREMHFCVYDHEIFLGAWLLDIWDVKLNNCVYSLYIHTMYVFYTLIVERVWSQLACFDHFEIYWTCGFWNPLSSSLYRLLQERIVQFSWEVKIFLLKPTLWGYKFWQLQGPKVGLQDSQFICIFEDAVVPPGPSVAVQHFSDTFCWYPVEVASEPTILIDSCSGTFDVEHLSKHPLRPTESKKIGTYQLTISISKLYPIGTYWEESDPQDGDPFLFTGRQERVLLKEKFYVSQNIPLGELSHLLFFSCYLCTCVNICLFKVIFYFLPW